MLKSDNYIDNLKNIRISTVISKTKDDEQLWYDQNICHKKKCLTV